MNLIAIDTATEACSVALWQNGAVLEHYEVAGRSHSARLPLMFAALLAEAGLHVSQLDGIVSGIGPGSFAGVRIGVSFAKGLALGSGLPVVGVSSLAMLAQAALVARAEATVLAAIDARMDEVYFGVYRAQAGVAMLLAPEKVCPAAATAELLQALELGAGGGRQIGVGSGWRAHGDALLASASGNLAEIDALALPHAAAALALAAPRFAAGQVQDAATLVPTYLRNRVALTKVEQEALRQSKRQ
ncbi:MAG: tRNA (adenosine(37)-N6)-threonylcarbamoyltransferase complex dimerization subunit type 1 TsaB [Nevskia sp.]|jgi:tRNA threonylcarbamoyladenosine biosynthesis protein TsaB|nr:tRNA (adenosine(37)-N6)-threonylcarbamoyltransferase complex dimerization subunit type 1 TsaB [Nevskia sp.]MCK9385432.1 tRNA (adenosine(37)-N6)-threonylcarbamoyltransferase complex dimerization subunit type 1 TsaB [Nevskia sp.]